MECQCEAICNYLPLPPNSKTTLIMIMMSLHSSSCKSSSPVLQLRTPFARSSVAVSFQRRRRNRYRCIIMMTSLFSNLIQTHNPSHFFFFFKFWNSMFNTYTIGSANWFDRARPTLAYYCTLWF